MRRSTTKLKAPKQEQLEDLLFYRNKWDMKFRHMEFMSIVLHVASAQRPSTSTQQNMFSGEWTSVLLYSDSDNILTNNRQLASMNGGTAPTVKRKDQD
eukprot:9144346-Heterocapsa_arctica.AAC.1